MPDKKLFPKRPPVKKTSVAVVIRFQDEDQLERVRSAAAQMDMSINTFVRSAADSKAQATMLKKGQRAEDQ